MSSSSTTDREIVITRSLKAPRERVFAAFTDPAQIDQWWGPTGFRNRTLSMDVRVGGSWRFIMHGPNGVDYPNRITYTEITPPERLAYDHGDDVNDAPHFTVVITFEEENHGTRLTMRSLFPTTEARDFVVREFGAIEGGKQTVDRLEAYLVG